MCRHLLLCTPPLLWGYSGQRWLAAHLGLPSTWWHRVWKGAQLPPHLEVKNSYYGLKVLTHRQWICWANNLPDYKTYWSLWDPAHWERNVCWAKNQWVFIFLLCGNVCIQKTNPRPLTRQNNGGRCNTSFHQDDLGGASWRSRSFKFSTDILKFWCFTKSNLSSWIIVSNLSRIFLDLFLKK